jgi:hypothetical protein
VLVLLLLLLSLLEGNGKMPHAKPAPDWLVLPLLPWLLVLEVLRELRAAELPASGVTLLGLLAELPAFESTLVEG